MLTLNVRSKENNYEILCRDDLFADLGKIVQERYRLKSLTILTDENIMDFYGPQLLAMFTREKIKTNLIVIKPGEASKSFVTLQKVYEDLLKFNVQRQDYLLTLGGGVVGDLGGFAAATYLRGLKYIQVPTSLLAQVDSSIGGKVAIDLPQGKNLIGSFHPPQLVIIDPQLLRTLPEKFFNDGLAEVIKYGCIKDRLFFEKLTNYRSREELSKDLREIIGTCLTIKKHFVEIDEFDQGPRMILNFGHTLGHALERYFSYTKLTHGQAIAIGMHLITRFSEEQKISKPGTAESLRDIFRQYQLPQQISPAIMKRASEAIWLDKKSENQYINLILLKDLGRANIERISSQTVINYFQSR